jgi:hypothetical protein
VQRVHKRSAEGKARLDSYSQGMQISDTHSTLDFDPLSGPGGCCPGCPVERDHRCPGISDLLGQVEHYGLELIDLILCDARLQGHRWYGREMGSLNHFVIGVRRVHFGKKHVQELCSKSNRAGEGRNEHPAPWGYSALGCQGINSKPSGNSAVHLDCKGDVVLSGLR